MEINRQIVGNFEFQAINDLLFLRNQPLLTHFNSNWEALHRLLSRQHPKAATKIVDQLKGILAVNIQQDFLIADLEDEFAYFCIQYFLSRYEHSRERARKLKSDGKLYFRVNNQTHLINLIWFFVDYFECYPKINRNTSKARIEFITRILNEIANLLDNTPERDPIHDDANIERLLRRNPQNSGIILLETNSKSQKSRSNRNIRFKKN